MVSLFVKVSTYFLDGINISTVEVQHSLTDIFFLIIIENKYLK